ncbi:hypothetical protein ACFWGD_10910 [Corynebacterium sp. NPDC060344]|uniref:hypothetical protein n=1 Tax=Corynebacterium sp. NPDC060344 TaxID=3347101 RepID=UPI003662083C
MPSSMTARRATAACALAATLVAGACAAPDGSESGSGADDLRDGEWIIDDAVDPALAAEIDAIAEEFDGEAAIALALPGATSGDGPVSTGELSDVAAWSTSKVPVAIAAHRENPWVDDLIPSMISESDNYAAESLWVSLGGETAAAKAVNEVLEDGGDTSTEFEAWTAPGDVEWELPDQAAFAANLPCLDDADPVLEAMGDIVDYQSYGLGDIDGAMFKGGWGPNLDGEYLSRQLGTIPADGGVVGVAIAARPGDATDDTAREMLDAIAEAIAEHSPHGGRCEDGS